MLNYAQFEALLLIPALSALQLDNPGMRLLVTGTIAHESKGGTYIKQISGPALGICQMEGTTHDSIWNSYMPQYPALTHHLMTLCAFSRAPRANQMIHDLLYAIAMCAILYKMRLESHRQALPNSIEEASTLWKTFYNTNIGKGTTSEFINDYREWTGINSPSKSNSKNKGST